MANPNPSPETRFQPGNSGNAAGKTSAQRKRELSNAERATKLRERFLKAVEKSLDGAADSSAAALLAITGDMLKLLKDSEDRGLGTAKQSIDLGSDPDRPMVSRIDPTKLSANTLRELMAAHNAAPEPNAG